MIATIAWHFFEKGLHLVTLTNGRELTMTSSEIALDFSLGQLKRSRQ